MLKTKLTLALAATLALATLSPAAAQQPTPLLTKRTEAQLITVLKSDAPRKDKADACRELGIIGTRECVPVLAGMLADEQMNHSARCALETIADPSAGDTLRAALGQTKGRPLVGVISSVGMRRDAMATDALAKLLSDPDPDVAQAAARSLGKIGSSTAAKAIDGALAGTAAGNQVAFCEGLFRCAEALAAKGQSAEAIAIYDKLRGLKEPHQVQAGGLRGAILTRGQDGLPLLVQSIRSEDWIVVAAAARAALEMPGPAATQALLPEVATGSADKRVLVIQVLGKRGEAAALPTLFTAAKSGEKPVRLAAIRALPEIGNASAAPVLVELLGEADRELAQAAQDSLAALPGPEVDAAVMAMLNSDDPARRITGIDLTARRRMTTAIPALVKAAGDPDAKVRPAALKRLGELAGPADLPTLMALLTGAKSSQDLDAVETALSTLCSKAGDPEACAGKLTAMLPQLQPAQKGAVLRILSATGGPGALKAVRTSVSDPDPEVHAAALRALGDWKTADAAPDLLALARNANDPKDKMLCLRSYLGLARNADFPPDQRLSMCREVTSLIQSKDEKRLLMSALGSIQSVGALNMILPYLDDPAARDEAAAAGLSISERMLAGRTGAKNGPKLVAPLQKIAGAAISPSLAKRANALLLQAQGKAPEKK